MPETNEGLRPEESPWERLDRNWTEILQAGSQIITGFLLAAAFQQRFEDLSPVAYGIYFALLGTAVVTTIVGLTPVMIHRRLFRTGAKESLVRLGDRLATVALAGVGVTLAGIVLLIVELVAGIVPGILASAAALLIIALLWLLLPHRVGRARRREPER